MNGIRRLTLAAALASAISACGPGADEGSKERAAPGDDKLLAAYDRGLDFLAGKTKDGVVSVRGHPFTGVTAFTLLPVLERPGGAREKDRKLVDQVLAYLAKEVAHDGSVSDGPTSTYEASVVVLALAASKRPEYAAHVKRAANFVKSMQHADPAETAYGGFGGFRGDPRADLSITYYAMASLAAAGVPKDDPYMTQALAFLQRVQNRKANEGPGEPSQWNDPNLGRIVRGDDGGGCAFPGWSKAGFDAGTDGTKVPRSCGSMTYSLLHGYQMAGLGAQDERVRSAVDWISGHWAVDCNPGVPDEPPDRRKLDGLYYYWSTVARTLPALGIEKIRAADGRQIDWRAELSAAVLAAQKPDGSWQSTDVQWSESVSVIATTYALIALRPCVR